MVCMLKSSIQGQLLSQFTLQSPNNRYRLSVSRNRIVAQALHPMQAKSITSLKDIPETYDNILLDQFGVLHDGTKPYPNAIEGVQHLLDRGSKILIISNSSRRANGALNNLAKMGFPTEAFAGVITSGEVTHQKLSTRPDSEPFWKNLSTCIHITWSARGAISLQGLGINVTQSPSEADFILAHGTEALGVSIDGTDAEPCTLQELKYLLEVCSRHNLPLVVANPDVVTVHGTELRTMPGTLARWYQDDYGGKVHLMGKPSTLIYEAALNLLDNPRIERVIAIGDSMEHDIAGAASVGIHSVLIAGGIHADELLLDKDIRYFGLKKLVEDYGATPQYVMPYFEL